MYGRLYLVTRDTADRSNVKATITLQAEWVASLVGHDSVSDMVDQLRKALLADVEEVTTLPNVKVLRVEIATDGTSN